MELLAPWTGGRAAAALGRLGASVAEELDRAMAEGGSGGKPLPGRADGRLAGTALGGATGVAALAGRATGVESTARSLGANSLEDEEDESGIRGGGGGAPDGRRDPGKGGTPKDKGGAVAVGCENMDGVPIEPAYGLGGAEAREARRSSAGALRELGRGPSARLTLPLDVTRLASLVLPTEVLRDGGGADVTDRAEAVERRRVGTSASSCGSSSGIFFTALGRLTALGPLCDAVLVDFVVPVAVVVASIVAGERARADPAVVASTLSF